ncbi:zinc finger protein Xfin-like [Mizuhopecten yessoensis]|uniref:Zinc finger protein 268 n=1 Tax=Mizuhopecten yessoensis TaxID=6573 RepID=A0A210PIQ0_MIZYE|nr:zinc finger protein Xfin-like [Mizuhopecten yessoensis]XP_021340706.1 zinc finger protein Xfin-like [Mizuhopecten yessoensis]OWF36353.1 Zinc finger protein 268 [Mizuhopecten yessoensis]
MSEVTVLQTEAEVGRTDEEDASDKLFLGSSDTDDYISSDEESTPTREDNSSNLLSYDASSEPLNLCSSETKAMCNGARDPGEMPCTENGTLLEYSDLNEEDRNSENTGYDSSTNICYEEFDGIYSGYNSCDNSSHGDLPDTSHSSDESVTKRESQNGIEDSQVTKRESQNGIEDSHGHTSNTTGTNVESHQNICAKRENSAIVTDTELLKTDVYGCGSCGQQLSSKSGLRKHRCSQTAYTSTINAESSDEPEEEAAPPLKQSRCDLKPHKSFQCQLCEKSFSSQANCTRHMRNHIGDRPFSCEVCCNTFKMESDLHLHMSCHSDQTYSCDMCGEEFARQEYLRIHYTDERKAFACSICGQKIHSCMAYRNHMTNHQGDRPHVCEICDKSFPRSIYLKRHMAVHCGMETHTCVQCEKVFLDKNYLITHIQSAHSGLTNFQCSYCEKKFYNTGALTNHVKTHTRKKLFKCQVCKKVYQSKNEWRSHSRIHTEKHQFYTSILEEKATSDNDHAENSINFNNKVDKSSSPRAHNSSKTVGVMVMKVDKEGKPAEAKVTVSGSGEDGKEQRDIGTKKEAGQDAVPSDMSVIVVKIKQEEKEIDKRSTASPNDASSPRYTSLASHTPYNGITEKSSHPGNTITPLIPDDTSDLHDDLDQVVTLNTPEGVMYQCKVCGYQTRIKQSMLKHSRSHRGKKQSCRFCDALFADQYSLQHHYCTTHGEETFVSRDLVLNKHASDPGPQTHRHDPQKLTSNGTLHNLPFQTESNCHQPGQESLSRPVSSELSYRCEWCGKSYEKYQLYLDHCMTSHAQRKSYQCLKCHAKFSWRNSLHQHAKFCMNTEIEIYKCDQCPSEFKRKRDLKVHVEGKHGETEKLHTCSCGKTYKWQSGLARHRSKSGCSVEYVIHPSKFRA